MQLGLRLVLDEMPATLAYSNMCLSQSGAALANADFDADPADR